MNGNYDTLDDEANALSRQLINGAEHDVLYRVPAREDYDAGDHVGFVRYEGWSFAVNWRDGQIVSGRFAIVPESTGCFPYSTWWMITNNSAIDHDIPMPEDRNGGLFGDA